MDLSAVAKGLKHVLETTGIRIYDHGPEAPIAPCAYVYPENVTYGVTTDGAADLRFVVQLLAASIETEGGQFQLLTMLSTDVTGSLIDKLKADKTLNGSVNDSVVLPMRNWGARTALTGTTRFWSAEIPIQIFD
jgi:hypothetical protein